MSGGSFPPFTVLAMANSFDPNPGSWPLTGSEFSRHYAAFIMWTLRILPRALVERTSACKDLLSHKWQDLRS